MMWIDYEAQADRWQADREAEAWWAEEEAQYAEDRKNFLEAMNALYGEQRATAKKSQKNLKKLLTSPQKCAKIESERGKERHSVAKPLR